MAEKASSSTSSSILDKLRPPKLSEITHKRKVRVNNPPHTGARTKKKPTSRCATDPKTLSVSDRAREFKHEIFVVSGGKLFCSACREEVSLKLSIIRNHNQLSMLLVIRKLLAVTVGSMISLLH